MTFGICRRSGYFLAMESARVLSMEEGRHVEGAPPVLDPERGHPWTPIDCEGYPVVKVP